MSVTIQHVTPEETFRYLHLAADGSCPRCGGTMIGDGVNTVLHCESADEEDYFLSEGDAPPVLCREVAA